MIKTNKGITLIALVITIIVLLILAGVSIAMLTGDNGILTQATNAQTQTRDAEIKEAISLAVSTINADLADEVSTPIYTALDYTNIVDAINDSQGAGTAKVSSDSDGIIYKYGSKQYKAEFEFTTNTESENIGVGAITITEYVEATE